MSASVLKVEKTRNRSLNDDTPPNLVQMRERSVSEIILTVPVKERRNRRSNDNINVPITVIEEESETDLGRLGSVKSLSALSGTTKVQRVPSRNSTHGSHGNLSTISNNGFNRITGQRHVLEVPNNRQNGSIEGSVNTVVHEQYCSCMRWSRLEKTLVIMVSILAFMVVILVITVGVLAGEKSKEEGRGIFKIF